jgi:general nucleoside transport system permease protein
VDVAQFVITSALTLSVPIIFVALGGMWSLTVGELNIGLEGQMLIGAFISVTVAYATGSTLVGVVSGGIAGIVSGLLFGVLVVYLKGDPFIVGITTNILFSALTVMLLGLLFRVKGSFSDPSLKSIARFPVGPIADVPIIGRILGDQSVMFGVMILAVAASWYVLRFTTLGLRLRIAGEKPEALLTAGIRVPRMRLVVQLVTGLLCGLGGAELAMGSLTLFSTDMTAGRGFVAIGIVIIVGSRPVILAVSTLGYGILASIGLDLQQTGFPPQIPQMLPYLAAIVAMVLIAVRRTRRNRQVTLDTRLATP